MQELKPDEAKRLMKEMDPPGAEKAYFALGCCKSSFRSRGSLGWWWWWWFWRG